MPKESLMFPLVPEVRLRLPKGTTLTGIEVRRGDITFLLLDVPGDKSLKDRDLKKEPVEEFSVLIFLEGEREKVTEEQAEKFGGARFVPDEERPLIAIPEEDATLRKLGVAATKETPAVWHIFQRVKPAAV